MHRPSRTSTKIYIEFASYLLMIMKSYFRINALAVVAVPYIYEINITIQAM
jgi:hypothetical protein